MPALANRPTAKPPIKPKARKARPKRPSSLAPVLEALNLEYRPEFIPEDAILLCAWTRIPGGNTQKGEDWRVARNWQVPVIEHFSSCMEEYLHPGVLEHPRVHVLILSNSPGDIKNRGLRAKFIIDRLQIKREVEFRKITPRGEKQRYGVRVYGLLGLITDDSVLTDETCTIDEQRVTVTVERNDCKVLVWVWDDPPAPF